MSLVMLLSEGEKQKIDLESFFFLHGEKWQG